MVNSLSKPEIHQKALSIIYLSNLLLSFHYFLILYIHSSFLSIYVNASQLALLFVAGSILNLFIFLNIPHILERIGNYKFTLWAIIFEGLAITGMALGTSAWTISMAFILHQAVISMILFGLDIFLEGTVKNEAHTGTIRGIYLTLSNLTLVFSPLIAGILIANSNFKKVYFISLILLVPLFLLVQRNLKHAAYKYKDGVRITTTYLIARKNKDVRGVLYAHFMLQFFYAWMVIYVPIFLHQHIGFDWKEIGVIFTVMLLPFLLFELPIGRLADKKFGEKEIMLVGFVIMAVSTFYIPLISSTHILVWAVVLFLTRVGASFVEITSESYFFKHVNEKNPGLISLFRMARPLAYITAPAVVTGSIAVFGLENDLYAYIFPILSVFMFLGMRYALSITDTK